MAALYRYPTPVIELELVAGGSLTPDTTYYFACRYRGSMMDSSGPLSEQVSITTDTTNLSIRVKIKWWNVDAWDYNRPVTSFYAANLSNYQIVWDTADMTDGLGNYVFIYRPAMIALVQGYDTTYDVTYTTNPVKANQFYVLIPELYGYATPSEQVIPSTWSKLQGKPILYSTSAADTWTTMKTALESDPTFTNYLFTGTTYLIAEIDIYIAHGVTMDDLTIILLQGSFFSSGTHNRCNISTNCSYGAIGAGIIITAGSDCVLKSNRYRPSLTINGNNNSIYSFLGQIQPTAGDVSFRKYISCFCLTNGMNGAGNYSLYNSQLYRQILNVNEINTNVYQYTDVAIMGAASYDLTQMNAWGNAYYTMTFNNYRIDTNRATSEGINYSIDKKPRFNWVPAAPETYVNKLYIFNNSVDFYITDENGDPITTAIITMSNEFETVTGNTDTNGYLQKYIKIRTANQDPTYTVATSYTIWVDYKTVDVTIEKAGYETYITKLNLLETTDLFVQLKPVVKTKVSTEGNLLVALQPELGTDSQILEV